MKIDLGSGEIRLADNSPLSLRGARGVRITCTAGTIWITVADEPGDTFLAPGQAYVVQGNGLAIVESIGAGSIRIARPAPGSFRQTWLAWLRQLSGTWPAAVRSMLRPAPPWLPGAQAPAAGRNARHGIRISAP